MSDDGADTIEHWPAGEVPWQDPPYLPTNEVIWQGAIDDALTDGSLGLEQTAHPDFAELVGECPRCGHRLRQPLEFRVVRGAAEGPVGRVGRFNVDCGCNEPHEGRPDDRLGCGWGGPLPVEIRQEAR